MGPGFLPFAEVGVARRRIRRRRREVKRREVEIEIERGKGCIVFLSGGWWVVSWTCLVGERVGSERGKAR